MLRVSSILMKSNRDNNRDNTDYGELTKTRLKQKFTQKARRELDERNILSYLTG